MNVYEDTTLTVDDLEADERCSIFTNCTFSENGNSDPIQDINFSFATFTGCTWDSDAVKCNFKGAIGNTIPSLMTISFSTAPGDGVIVKDEDGIIFVGDGSTTDFTTQRLNATPVETAISDAIESASPTVVAGKVLRCGMGSATLSKSEYKELCNIELTTDATDTASPINGVPDITADGTSSCTLIIKKINNAGNYKTTLSDDDTITLECTRGKLSALQTTLVDGEATVTLTSATETCVATVTASNDDLGDAAIDIQFAP